MSVAEKKDPNPYEPKRQAGDDRELFVTTDLRSIPMMELRPMCGGISQWLSAILNFKILRASSDVTYAYESRRLVRVEPQQVSRRIMNHFDELRPAIEQLGFVPNYFASMPAIGRIAAAVMAMSRLDGKVHCFAVQVAAMSDGQINDDGHVAFTTHLTDGGSIITMSPANLPAARDGVDRQILATDDPNDLLRSHRQRIRNAPVKLVQPNHLFEYAERETRLVADDLLRRRIIRPATPAEVGRIRAASRE